MLELVVDDERHHHRVFGELLNTLCAGAGSEGGSIVPRIVPLPETPGLVTATEQYLELERADRRELEQLEKELRHLRETSIWPLLVEVMKGDTDKHIRILEFIRDHLLRALHSTPAQSRSS